MQVISRERSRRECSSSFVLSIILMATFSKAENGQRIIVKGNRTEREEEIEGRN